MPAAPLTPPTALATIPPMPRVRFSLIKPSLVAVVGRSPKHVSEEKSRQILTGAAPVKVMTYDDLRLRMQKMASRLSL